MAEVTPDDVILLTWRDQSPTAIALIQPGGLDPKGHVLPMGAVRLTAPGIFALAAVTVRGTPGEDVGFWRFGFVQLKFITDEWVHFRGATPADGSVFVALDRPPARPQQLCRDSLAKGGIVGTFQRFPFLGPVIFYDAEQPLTGLWGGRVSGFLPLGTRIPAGGAMLLTILFSDSPERHHDLVRLNTALNPARNNFLHSLYTGAAYATMFAVQKGPNQPIVVMKSFTWNVRWRAHFGMNAGVIVQLPPRPGDVQDMNISHVVKGPPNDGRFPLHSILDTELPNCNNVLRAAFANPAAVHTSPKWEDWKVSH